VTGLRDGEPLEEVLGLLEGLGFGLVNDGEGETLPGLGLREGLTLGLRDEEVLGLRAVDCEMEEEGLGAAGERLELPIGDQETVCDAPGLRAEGLRLAGGDTGELGVGLREAVDNGLVLGLEEWETAAEALGLSGERLGLALGLLETLGEALGLRVDDRETLGDAVGLRGERLGLQLAL
jgi:hypothetical protein